MLPRLRRSTWAAGCTAALATCVLVTARGAVAQATPKPAASGAAASAPTSSLTPTDQQYLSTNAQGSVYDLTLSELGLLRGTSPRVRDYAHMVLRDHARLNAALLDLAHREGAQDLSLTMSSEDNGHLQRLMGLRGAEFDRAFAEEEVRINAQDVSDAEKELKATKSAAVRRVVQEFHTTEARHLAGARALQGGSGSAAGAH